ncbi:MAG: HD domain-containing protein [Bacilli bacterium]|jgi:putative hydrolase of HD superfamily|nr:HD domain-containing protein [Bacilli bacterium]
MKASSVVKYYVLNNKLKHLIRTGWTNWNVKKERVESVAEHIYGVEALAIAMYSEYKYDIDLYKVILMIAIHELEEVLIGDLTAWQVSKEEKERLGHEAIKKVLGELLIKDELEALVLEFDERKTKEAIFAYHCDKLECDLQCKLYDEEGCVDLNDQPNNNPSANDPRVQELLKMGYSWSKMWLDYDKSKYQDDNNFLEVLEYIENNEISIR